MNPTIPKCYTNMNNGHGILPLFCLKVVHFAREILVPADRHSRQGQFGEVNTSCVIDAEFAS